MMEHRDEYRTNPSQRAEAVAAVRTFNGGAADTNALQGLLNSGAFGAVEHPGSKTTGATKVAADTEALGKAAHNALQAAVKALKK